ncbi:MAG: hypothetical protein ACJ754_18895 [Pyrinomonadaceae bacterium]
MRNGTKQKLRLVALAALLIAGSSCSLTGLTKGKGLAETAVAHFHEQYNAGQFREIYAEADEEFKKSASEADFLALLEALRRKLGTVGQAEQAGWHVNATTMGTMVTLGYNVEFSEGKGAEQFVFRVSGEKALLYNYNVNSPLLITK